MLLVILILGLQGCNFESKQPWYSDLFDQQYEQVDRVGIPHLDEVFFGDGALTAIREGDPQTDEDELLARYIDGLTVLRGRLASINGYSDLADNALSEEEVAVNWTPNTLYIDVSEPVSFVGGNGRAIGVEDSFDIVITDALGRFSEDLVAVQDRGLLKKFPFLRSPRKISCVEKTLTDTEETGEEEECD